jgi:hypothetical protein
MLNLNESLELNWTADGDSLCPESYFVVCIAVKYSAVQHSAVEMEACHALSYASTQPKEYFP